MPDSSNLPEQVVVLCSCTLTLEDLDQHTGLVVGVGGEDFGFLGGDGGVALDERGHDTTGSLDTHGQGGNIQQQEILSLLGGVAGEDGGLDSGTVGNGLVGVDGLVGLLCR